MLAKYFHTRHFHFAGRNRTSTQKQDVQEHSVVHNEEVVRYHCAACSIPFESRDLLAIHVQLIHDRPSVVCNPPRILPNIGYCAPQTAIQVTSV